MASIFTKIINGEIPCFKIAETEDFLAFLDINPTAEGHTLAIPKNEIDYIFDLSNEQLSGLMHFCKRVAKALEKTLPCKRVGVAVIGTEVPHAHVHLIPFKQEKQMNIVGPKMKVSQERMAEIAKEVSANFE